MARSMKCVGCVVSVLLSLAVSFPVDDVVTYENSNDLKNAVTENNVFVLFCKPSVVSCKRATPLWEELRHLYHGNHSIAKLAQVVCSNDTTVCTDQNIKRVPVFRFFYKNSDDFSDFIGRRTFESLHRFVEDELHNADEISEVALPDAVVELGAKRFRHFVSEQLHFVHFYTPWCGHCKVLHPTWHHLALNVAGGSHLFISQVDCAKNSKLCASYDIKGYPSLVLFYNGTKLETYRGSRELSELTTYILSKVDQYVEEYVPEVHTENGVVQLTEDNFGHVINNNLVFVNFFTTWCAQCKEVNAAWEQLAQTNSDRGIMMATLDCERHSYLCDARSISVFPTLTVYQGGILLYDYHGNHSLPELQRLIDLFTAVEHDEL